MIISPLSRLDRGAFRPIVTKREAGCDGRKTLRAISARTSGVFRTAKACRPGAQRQVPSLAVTNRAATETTKPGLSGVSTQ
jgi:hypothetical protein